nr:MAG TPA: hypothetical protein [Caudoviricetes sp.]
MPCNIQEICNKNPTLQNRVYFLCNILSLNMYMIIILNCFI